MANVDKVLELALEKKILQAKDLGEKDIPSVYLTRLVESGDLMRIGRGLYVLPEYNRATPGVYRAIRFQSQSSNFLVRTKLRAR